MAASELDKLIFNAEFEHLQHVKLLEHENQLIESLEKEIEYKGEETKRLLLANSQLDVDTKQCHRQCVINKENVESQKKTNQVLTDHVAAMVSKLEMLRIKGEEERNVQEQQLKKYRDVFARYKIKYEMFPLAKELQKEKDLTAEIERKCQLHKEAVLTAKQLIHNLKGKKQETNKMSNKEFIVKLSEIKVATFKVQAELEQKQLELECLRNSSLCHENIMSASEIVNECNVQKLTGMQLDDQAPGKLDDKTQNVYKDATEIRSNFKDMNNQDKVLPEVCVSPMICVRSARDDEEEMQTDAICEADNNREERSINKVTQQLQNYGWLPNNMEQTGASVITQAATSQSGTTTGKDTTQQTCLQFSHYAKSDEPESMNVHCAEPFPVDRDNNSHVPNRNVLFMDMSYSVLHNDHISVHNTDTLQPLQTAEMSQLQTLNQQQVNTPRLSRPNTLQVSRASCLSGQASEHSRNLLGQQQFQGYSQHNQMQSQRQALQKPAVLTLPSRVPVVHTPEIYSRKPGTPQLTRQAPEEDDRSQQQRMEQGPTTHSDNQVVPPSPLHLPQRVMHQQLQIPSPLQLPQRLQQHQLQVQGSPQVLQLPLSRLHQQHHVQDTSSLRPSVCQSTRLHKPVLQSHLTRLIPQPSPRPVSRQNISAVRQVGVVSLPNVPSQMVTSSQHNLIRQTFGDTYFLKLKDSSELTSNKSTIGAGDITCSSSNKSPIIPTSMSSEKLNTSVLSSPEIKTVGSDDRQVEDKLSPFNMEKHKQKIAQLNKSPGHPLFVASRRMFTGQNGNQPQDQDMGTPYMQPFGQPQEQRTNILGGDGDQNKPFKAAPIKDTAGTEINKSSTSDSPYNFFASFGSPQVESNKQGMIFDFGGGDNTNASDVFSMFGSNIEDNDNFCFNFGLDKSAQSEAKDSSNGNDFLSCFGADNNDEKTDKETKGFTFSFGY